MNIYSFTTTIALIVVSFPEIDSRPEWSTEFEVSQEVLNPKDCLPSNGFICRKTETFGFFEFSYEVTAYLCLPTSLKCDGNRDCEDGSDEQNCNEPVPLGPCQKAYIQKNQTMEPGEVGVCLPECNSDGTFKPEQTCGSTGYSWCVTATGTIIPGTTTPPGQHNKLNCTALLSLFERPCLKLYNEIYQIKTRKPSVGGICLPKCDNEGYYQRYQSCPGDREWAQWCLDKNGTSVPCETRAAEPYRRPCQEALRDSRIPYFMADTNWYDLPQCDGERYWSIQCSNARNACWCVDNHGRPAGPEWNYLFLPGPRQCSELPLNESNNQSQCNAVRERAEQFARDHNLTSSYFKPNCSSSGDYEPRQCGGDYCWCVDVNRGVETPGTRSLRDLPIGLPHNCKDVEEIPYIDHSRTCEQESAKIRSAIERYSLLGVPVPQCDDRGLFEPRQCWKNMCWCVNEETGKEINGSEWNYRSNPNHRCSTSLAHSEESTNEEEKKGPCNIKLEKMEELVTIQPLLDLYLPSCSLDGYFSPQQCWNDYCWHVTRNGDLVPDSGSIKGKMPSKCKAYDVGPTVASIGRIEHVAPLCTTKEKYWNMYNFGGRTYTCFTMMPYHTCEAVSSHARCRSINSVVKLDLYCVYVLDRNEPGRAGRKNHFKLKFASDHEVNDVRCE